MQLVMSYKFIRPIKKLYSFLILVKFQVEKIFLIRRRIPNLKKYFKMKIKSRCKKILSNLKKYFEIKSKPIKIIKLL